MRTNKKIIFFSKACLMLAAVVHAQEPWTDSLRVKEGIFAIRAEPGRLVVIRADDRIGRSGSLRAKILREAGTPLLVSLRRIDADHAPWKYASLVLGWDGIASRIELEASEDGKKWHTVGVFLRR